VGAFLQKYARFTAYRVYWKSTGDLAQGKYQGKERTALDHVVRTDPAAATRHPGTCVKTYRLTL
jgi:hypothetical protein